MLSSRWMRRIRTRPSWRVYTIALVAVALLSSAAARAQVELTIEPAMVRGPQTARVTILEFSDYQ